MSLVSIMTGIAAALNAAGPVIEVIRKIFLPKELARVESDPTVPLSADAAREVLRMFTGEKLRGNASQLLVSMFAKNILKFRKLNSNIKKFTKEIDWISLNALNGDVQKDVKQKLLSMCILSALVGSKKVMDLIDADGDGKVEVGELLTVNPVSARNLIIDTFEDDLEDDIVELWEQMSSITKDESMDEVVDNFVF